MKEKQKHQKFECTHHATNSKDKQQIIQPGDTQMQEICMQCAKYPRKVQHIKVVGATEIINAHAK